jgi:inhibitor of KinA sporulation pathway (predicted exonuclease)
MKTHLLTAFGGFARPWLLVVDLEATCDDGGRVPRREMETIEIGAVLVDGATLEPAAELATFVRPRRHPILTPFCTALTTITQADVDAAPTFPEAIDALARFLALQRASPVLFASWGDYDKHQLAQDAAHHGVRLPLGEHVNLKARFSERLGLRKKLGMAGALARVGLRLEGTHHRGIDDARNIARLLPWALGRAGERRANG